MSSTIPATSGIYRITCIVTTTFYIGSTINLRKRWKDHRYELSRGRHNNSKLQRAWNKYGEQAFTFEVLELVLPMSLTAREQYWFDTLKPFGKKGFNLARVAGTTLGLKLSPENLARRFGREVSLETRKKMSDVRQGRPGPTRGRKLSLEHRAKLSGKHPDPEFHASQMKTLILTSPEGEVYVVRGIKRFCREHNLDISCLMRVANGRVSQHKGWKASYSPS